MTAEDKARRMARAAEQMVTLAQFLRDPSLEVFRRGTSVVLSLSGLVRTYLPGGGRILVTVWIEVVVPTGEVWCVDVVSDGVPAVAAEQAVESLRRLGVSDGAPILEDAKWGSA